MNDVPSSSFDNSESKLESLREILSGEEYKKVYPSVKELLDVDAENWSKVSPYFTDQDIPDEDSEQEEDPEEKYQFENLKRACMDDERSSMDLEIEKIELINTLKKTFKDSPLDQKLRRFALDYPQFDVEDMNYISSEQEGVLKAWLMYDTIINFEKLQEIQRKKGEEIEEMEMPAPHWLVRKLAWFRCNLLERLHDLKAQEIDMQLRHKDVL